MQAATETICNAAISCRPLVVIPVFNHGQTLRQVVCQALELHPHVLVVDDGSTDGGVDRLAGLDCDICRHPSNRGKGAAILTAAAYARQRDMTHIITLDADGQHDPADIPRFFPVIAEHPTAIVVGARDFDVPNVPGSSRFGRRFSGFWLRVQTGCEVADVQSGFRAYPVQVLEQLALRETGYAFEVEVLVKAAWAGFPLRDLNISVFYPEPDQRISHFDKFRDNVRISLLNTRLTTRAILPLPHRKFALNQEGRVSLVHPLRSLRLLLSDRATPRELAFSGALGMILGTWPLVGMHSVAILFSAGYLRLNRICALAVSQLCMPPIVPALCVAAGYYVRNGRFLTEFSMETLGYQALQRLGDYIVGSLLMAPILALLVAAPLYLVAKLVQRGLHQGTRHE